MNKYCDLIFKLKKKLIKILFRKRFSVVLSYAKKYVTLYLVYFLIFCLRLIFHFLILDILIQFVCIDGFDWLIFY
jgi:hypothetical protein